MIVNERNVSLIHLHCTVIIGEEKVFYYVTCKLYTHLCTGLSKKMDGIWNRYNLKSTGRIYTFGILKCSEKF